jgi:adenine-specific DNA-methyltransferase
MIKKKLNYQKKGQYFTKNNMLKEKLWSFILNNPENILEPSIGRGDLVDLIQRKNKDISLDIYEIDETIELMECIKKDEIKYGDFLIQKITKKYKTIIGNPPYVKTKKGNLYIDFIEKCFNLLEDRGELIFIIPSDFFKLTMAKSIINKMLKNGTFTHIYHPHSEHLFKNATIDVVIFRYSKDKELDNKVKYNDETKYLINSDGVITFSNIQKTKELKCFKKYFDIYVGIVSGKESVFKNTEFGNRYVLNGKNKLNKYILIDNFPTENSELNEYLLSHKEVLIKRKIKKFTEYNWFQWGALRNIKKVEKNIGKKCIYIHNLSRKKEIAFAGKVNYFGGNLLILIPKVPINLDKLVSYLNSDKFKINYMYSKRFKIGHRQLSNHLFKYGDFAHIS